MRERLAATVQSEHEKECEDARLNFPIDLELMDAATSRFAFSDADFETHDVGSDAKAGPDAPYLRGASRVHLTRDRVVSEAEIRDIVEEASAAMAAGVTSNFTYTKRHNLDEVHTAHLPAAKAWLTRRLSDTLLPLLADRYGVRASSLRVFDSLVIHYDAAKDAVRQPAHRDASLLSLNIALSSGGADYEGGGTFFEGLGRSLGLPRGHVMCHPSGMRHGGHTISRGERWVLVVFVISEDVSHAPRRAAEHAWDAMTAGKDLPLSEALYRETIAMDGADHELHYGLATVLAMQGRRYEARQSLLTSLRAYPLSPKPHLALGSLLLKAGRLRAAMRRFERALGLTPDFGEEDAWEAARYSGLCGVRIAQKLGPSNPLVWELLPLAAGRLRQAAEARPGDEALRGLLEQAEQMRAMLESGGMGVR